MTDGAAVPTPIGVYAALPQAQGEFPPISKNQTAQVKSDKGNYSYKYADLGDILTAVRPALAKHSLALSQPIEMLEGGRLVLRTSLIHADGSALHSQLPLPLPGDRPQAFGSALTYLRRYAATSLLGIATEEDDDGQAAQHSGGGGASPAPRSSPARDTGVYRGPDGSEVRTKPRPGRPTWAADEGAGSTLAGELRVMMATIAEMDAGGLAAAREWLRATPRQQTQSRWTMLGDVDHDLRNEAAALMSRRATELTLAAVPPEEEPHGDVAPVGAAVQPDPWGIMGIEIEALKVQALAHLESDPWPDVEAAWAIYGPVLKQILHPQELRPLHQAWIKRFRAQTPPTSAHG